VDRVAEMTGWYVNYYSVTQRTERRSGASPSFDGALVHARALTINGHIVRSIVGPNSTVFDAGLFPRRYREKSLDDDR
jgi:hypothetical protein